MFFTKKRIIGDSAERILLNEEGTKYLPLQCDPDMYTVGIEMIKHQLQSWMVQDLSIAGMTNQPIESTLLYQLKEIDLKFLPFSANKETLKKCMQDTAISFSGSRLLDVIVRISVEVPVEVLETIKGKFLYAMLYCIPSEINDIEMPTKRMWLDVMREIPWCHYLVFLQELYDTDSIIQQVEKITANTRRGNTNVNVVATPMAPTSAS